MISMLLESNETLVKAWYFHCEGAEGLDVQFSLTQERGSGSWGCRFWDSFVAARDKHIDISSLL